MRETGILPGIFHSIWIVILRNGSILFTRSLLAFRFLRVGDKYRICIHIMEMIWEHRWQFIANKHNMHKQMYMVILYMMFHRQFPWLLEGCWIKCLTQQNYGSTTELATFIYSSVAVVRKWTPGMKASNREWEETTFCAYPSGPLMLKQAPL